MTDSFTCVYRLVIMAVLAVVGAAVDWILFYRILDTLTDLAGSPLFIGTTVAALRVGGGFIVSILLDYDVARVAAEGPISHDGGGGPIPGYGGGTPANDITEQADTAADGDSVDTLLVRLSVPGGEMLPGDDIRRAVANFDGPTVVYVMDICAPGGYQVANGCDGLWSHDMSVVGSIDVTGPPVNASELADEVGLPYKWFTAGRYKDARMALKEPIENEYKCLQGLINDYYDDFIEHMAEGRDMDPQVVRGTEARVYFDKEAHELGSVDSLGSRDDAENRLAERLGCDEVSVREFTPEVGLTDWPRGDAGGVACAFSAGLASSVDPNDSFSFRF